MQEQIKNGSLSQTDSSALLYEDDNDATDLATGA